MDTKLDRRLFKNLILRARLRVVSLALSGFAAAGVAVAAEQPSGQASDFSTYKTAKGSVDIFENSARTSSAITFRAGDQLTRFEKSPGTKLLIHESRTHGFKTTFYYHELLSNQYVLDRISFAQVRPMYLGTNGFDAAPQGSDNDGKSESASEQIVTSKNAATCGDINVPGSIHVVNKTLFSASKADNVADFAKDCSGRSNALKASLTLLHEPSRVLKCQQQFSAFQESAKRISMLVMKSGSVNFTCSSTERSRFDEPSSITIGQDIIRSTSEPTNALYHELLHATGASENVDRLMVQCCVERSSKAACEMIGSISDQTPYTKQFSLLEDFKSRALDQAQSNIRRLAVAFSKLPKPKIELLNSKVTRDRYADEVAKVLLAYCKDAKMTADCKQLVDAVRTQIAVGGVDTDHKHQIFAYNAAGQLIGQRAAQDEQSLSASNDIQKLTQTDVSKSSDVSQKISPVRILAEEPRYSPGGASSEDMKRDAQRYDGAMAKVAEQAQSYERTIAANVGWGIANAAPAKLPFANSDGSTSTTLKSFNPMTGESTLNALNSQGQPITITSAPVSFDGTPPSIEVRNVTTGAVIAATGTYKNSGKSDTSANGRSAPVLDSNVAVATGTTKPQRFGPSVDTGAIAVGAESATIPAGNATSNSGSISLASTSASASAPKQPAAFQKSESTLNVKQLVMRAPYGDYERMKSLYEKVRAADFKVYEKPEENPSVTFRYCGATYPLNFNGKNFVNLDVPNAAKANICAGKGRLDE